MWNVAAAEKPFPKDKKQALTGAASEKQPSVLQMQLALCAGALGAVLLLRTAFPAAYKSLSSQLGDITQNGISLMEENPIARLAQKTAQGAAQYVQAALQLWNE